MAPALVAQLVSRLGYGLNDRGSVPSMDSDVSFFFATASRLALRPTQPPIRWVPGDLSPEVKCPGCEAEYSPLSSAEVKKGRSYTSAPPIMSSWHGA
jgi:hypothetical protein